MEGEMIGNEEHSRSDPQDAGVSTSTSEYQELRKHHQREREALGLLKSPLQTLKFFSLACLEHGEQAWRLINRKWHVLSGGSLLLLLCVLSQGIEGPHRQAVREAILYGKFALWWVLLGIASSIGLGSGLHTFVLYLGPSVAQFTIRATQCGRVDLKGAPYDTPQWGAAAGWAARDCTSFGLPLYPEIAPGAGYRVPMRHILRCVQLESFLWGVGTAMGELPPYFVSRAARLSGERVKELDELEPGEPSVGRVRRGSFTRAKIWFFSRAEHFGFFTILLFASVPNPLFDLAGITCGHFLVPFWKFFTATCIGKAIVKVHLQIIFIILVFNAHAMVMLEEYIIKMCQHLPFASHVDIPEVIAALVGIRGKFSGEVGKKVQSRLSPAAIWNTIVLLMVAGFIGSIITSVAKAHLIEKQNREAGAMKERTLETRSEAKKDK